MNTKVSTLVANTGARVYSKPLFPVQRNQNAELRIKAAALTQSIRTDQGQVSRLDGIYRQADDCFFSVEAEIVVARKTEEEMHSHLARLQLQTENGPRQSPSTLKQSPLRWS
mmetsp:Transcript_6417/g.27306  ORF Transcript_6417/g.27306 Transcript_6417/m.27306 type:complete len:112 (-) Transcript_6417:1016-1351(-)